MMKYFKHLAGALFALVLMAAPAFAALDFTEGQMIPTTLKNGYTFSGANTFSGVVTQSSTVLKTPPATQTVGAGDTVAADACGGLKRLTAAGAVTTGTTNTFTAPGAANTGCCMDVVNVGGTHAITLDGNALFLVGGSNSTNVALTAGDSARVCSDGGAWYLITSYLTP